MLPQSQDDRKCANKHETGSTLDEPAAVKELHFVPIARPSPWPIAWPINRPKIIFANRLANNLANDNGLAWPTVFQNRFSKSIFTKPCSPTSAFPKVVFRNRFSNSIFPNLLSPQIVFHNRFPRSIFPKHALFIHTS